MRESDLTHEERWELNERVEREVYRRPTRLSTDGQWRRKFTPVGGWSLVPDYARDPRAAFWLVEQLQEDGWTVGLTSDVPTTRGPQWRADLHHAADGEVADGFADTPALAICVAALATAAPRAAAPTTAAGGEEP